jgi:hypothetical protein
VLVLSGMDDGGGWEWASSCVAMQVICKGYDGHRLRLGSSAALLHEIASVAAVT